MVKREADHRHFVSIFPHRHTNLIFSSPINYIFLGTANSAYNIQNCRKQGVCDLGVLVLGDIFILAYRRNFVVPASHSCENAGGQSAVQHVVKAVGIIQKTVGFLKIFFKAVTILIEYKLRRSIAIAFFIVSPR